MCQTKILLKRESINWLDILFLKISFGKLSIPTNILFFALSITFCFSSKDKTQLNISVFSLLPSASSLTFHLRYN